MRQAHIQMVSLRNKTGNFWKQKYTVPIVVKGRNCKYCYRNSRELKIIVEKYKHKGRVTQQETDF